MSHNSPFKLPFKLVTRQPVKHGGYVKIRDELQELYPILSNQDIDKILPIKSKLFEDKLSNDIIVYGFVDDEPLFFRYHLTKPQNTKGKGKKSDDSHGQLIPTVFTIWKVPHILPPVYTNSKVFPKITGVRSTSLFLPGLICPDLPDIFYLRGRSTPSYQELFPNTTLTPYDPQLHSNSSSPSSPFPKYFNSQSFNYMLQPGELRAMYVLGNPYCIGVCIVPDKIKSYDLLSFARKSGASARYLPPWSGGEWITEPQVMDQYPAKQTHPSLKWPIKMNPSNISIDEQHSSQTSSGSTSSTADDEGEPTTTTTVLKPGQHIVQQPDDITSPTSSVPLLSLITVLARYLSVSRDATATPYLLLLRAIVADPFFQPILSLHVPTFGCAAGHTGAPTLDLITTATTVFDTRPLGSGIGLPVLHSLNDTLAALAPHRYPQDAFTFTSADQCVPKLHQECAFQWRRVFVLLRIAYLSSVCQPILSLNVTGAVTIPKTFQFSLGTLAGLLPGAGGATAQQQQPQQQHIFKVHVDPTVIESDFIVVGDGEDIDDDDDDEDLDEDDEHDDDNENTTPRAICANCYQARLDWALQYVVNNPSTEFPLQYSALTGLLRLCSTCPNGIKYIHSPQYKNELIGPSCTCSGCATSSSGGQRNNNNTIESCECVSIQTDLAVTDSPYQKVGALVKKGDKRGWLKTKTISGHPVISASGGLSAKITETDRRAVDEYTTQYKQDIKQSAGHHDDGHDKHHSSARVNMTKLSQFTPALGQFLAKCCPDYIILTTFLEQKLKTASLANAQLEISDLLAMFQKKCLSSNVGDATRITSAILGYIRQKQLDIVIRDGVIVKCHVGDDKLPPVVQSLVDPIPSSKKKSNRNGYDSDDSDDDSSSSDDNPINGVWGQKSGVAAVKQKQPTSKTINAQQSYQDGELSDDDDDIPSLNPYGREYDHEDDLDSFETWDNRKHGDKKPLPKHPHQTANRGGNKKGAQQQQQQQRQTGGDGTKQKKDKKQQQQQQQQQPHVQHQRKAAALPNTRGTFIYLAYDQELYKALNLQQNKSYLHSDLTGIITKQLKSVHVSSTDYIRDLSILSDSSAYIDLILQSKKGISESQVHQQLKKLPQDIQHADASLTKHFQGSITNIQEAIMLISTLSFRASSVPSILVASVRVRGKLVSLICGLERYGIDPYRLANDSELKQYLACSVTALDIEEYKTIRMLISAKIDPLTRAMVQVQGDQITRICSFLEDTLGIPRDNITTLSTKKK